MRRLAAGTLVIVSLIAGAPPFASGDGLVNSETFGGFQFNFNNPGARALGMGGAFVAVADDATAVVANPAGLVILQRPEISAEAKFTRYRNKINAFTNTPEEGDTNRVHSRVFEDEVITPSFFSFVYPTERLVVAVFARELVNYESQFHTEGTFFTAPNGDFFRLFPVRSELEITALNFGLGAGINLEKQHPLLPNIGASLEFSFGRIRARLERFNIDAFFGEPTTLRRTETVDGTDIGVGFNVGALWRPVKNLALGAVYRRGPRFDMTYEEVDIFRDFGGNVIDTDTATAPLSLKIPDVIAAGVSYRFFERLTVAFEASYIFYSQLVDDFQVVVGNSRPGRHRLDDAVELHIGAEYVFFVKETPLAARAGFYTNPDHKIRYVGAARNFSDVEASLRYKKGEDQYHVTGGLGIVPFPGVQLDFAGNYSKELLEFSVSTVFRF
jgi:long-chain fatty acid transport protein